MTWAIDGYLTFDALSVAQCDAAVAEVHGLRREWTRRAPFRPVFTLGAPAYYDGHKGAETYLRLAALTNHLLQERFAEMFATVGELLASFLGEPVVYDPRVAVPGFHVFQSHPGLTQPLASRHFDLPYEQVPWDRPVDTSRAFSFTLPLRLPRDGAGMYMWDQTHGEPEAALDPEPILVPYRVGELVVHSGHRLHQIAPFVAHHEGDERVSWQGHAVFVDGAHVLYW